MRRKKKSTDVLTVSLVLCRKADEQQTACSLSLSFSISHIRSEQPLSGQFPKEHEGTWIRMGHNTLFHEIRLNRRGSYGLSVDI